MLSHDFAWRSCELAAQNRTTNIQKIHDELEDVDHRAQPLLPADRGTPGSSLDFRFFRRMEAGDRIAHRRRWGRGLGGTNGSAGPAGVGRASKGRPVLRFDLLEFGRQDTNLPGAGFNNCLGVNHRHGDIEEELDEVLQD